MNHESLIDKVRDILHITPRISLGPDSETQLGSQNDDNNARNSNESLKDSEKPSFYKQREKRESFYDQGARGSLLEGSPLLDRQRQDLQDESYDRRRRSSVSRDRRQSVSSDRRSSERRGSQLYPRRDSRSFGRRDSLSGRRQSVSQSRERRPSLRRSIHPFRKRSSQDFDRRQSHDSERRPSQEYPERHLNESFHSVGARNNVFLADWQNYSPGSFGAGLNGTIANQHLQPPQFDFPISRQQQMVAQPYNNGATTLGNVTNPNQNLYGTNANETLQNSNLNSTQQGIPHQNEANQSQNGTTFNVTHSEINSNPPTATNSPTALPVNYESDETEIILKKGNQEMKANFLKQLLLKNKPSAENSKSCPKKAILKKKKKKSSANILKKLLFEDEVQNKTADGSSSDASNSGETQVVLKNGRVEMNADVLKDILLYSKKLKKDAEEQQQKTEEEIEEQEQEACSTSTSEMSLDQASFLNSLPVNSQENVKLKKSKSGVINQILSKINPRKWRRKKKRSKKHEDVQETCCNSNNPRNVYESSEDEFIVCVSEKVSVASSSDDDDKSFKKTKRTKRTKKAEEESCCVELECEECYDELFS